MLSIEDRLAIDDLYSKYNHYIDFDRFDDWVSLFTDDGVFQSTHAFAGRDELKRFVSERALRVTPYINGHHWNTNLLLQQDGDVVRGVCYLLRAAVVKETGEKQIATLGRYEDVIVKTSAGWRFSHRTVLTV